MTNWLIVNNEHHKDSLKQTKSTILTKEEFFTFLLKHFLNYNINGDEENILYLIINNIIKNKKYDNFSVLELIKTYNNSYLSLNKNNLEYYHHDQDIAKQILDICNLVDQKITYYNIKILSKSLYELCTYLKQTNNIYFAIKNIEYMHLIDLNFLQAQIIKNLSLNKIYTKIYFPLELIDNLHSPINNLISFFETDINNNYLDIIFTKLRNNKNIIKTFHEYDQYSESVKIAKKIKYLKQQNVSDSVAIVIDDNNQALIYQQSLLAYGITSNFSTKSLYNNDLSYLLTIFLSLKIFSSKKYINLLLNHKIIRKKYDLEKINYHQILHEIGFVTEDNNYINNYLNNLNKFTKYYDKKDDLYKLINVFSDLFFCLNLFKNSDLIFNYIDHTITTINKISHDSCLLINSLNNIKKIGINNEISLKNYYDFLFNYLRNIVVTQPVNNIEFVSLKNSFFRSFDHVFFPNMIQDIYIDNLLFNSLFTNTKKSINLSAYIYDYAFTQKSFNDFFSKYNNTEQDNEYLNIVSLLEKKYSENSLFKNAYQQREKFFLYNKTDDYAFLLNSLNTEKAFLGKLQRTPVKSLTPTFVESFSQCAYAGFLRSILLVSVNKESIDPKKRYLGQIAHKVLEVFFKNNHTLIQLPSLIDMITKDFMHKYYFANENLFLNLIDELKVSLHNLIQELKKLPYETTFIEKAFGVGKHEILSILSYNNNNYNLGGIVDKINKHNKKYIIIDYKLSSISSIKNNINKKNIFKTNFQIPIYIKLLKDYFSCEYSDISVMFSSITDGKLLDIINEKNYENMFLSLNSQGENSLAYHIDNIFSPIKNGEIKAVVGPHCQSCNFNNICKKPVI